MLKSILPFLLEMAIQKLKSKDSKFAKWIFSEKVKNTITDFYMHYIAGEQEFNDIQDNT